MVDTINVKDAANATVAVATNDAVKTSVDLVTAATNTVATKIDTLDGSVDATTTAVNAVKTSTDLVKTATDAVKTSTDLVKTATDAVKAAVDIVAAKIDTLDGSVDATTTAVVANTVAVTAGSVGSLGAKTVALSPAVNIATDQPAIPTAPQSAAADQAVTITRSANTTAYPALSVVTNAAGGAIQFTTLGKAAGASVVITGAQLEYDVAALPAGIGSFNLYLYSAAPGVIADNALFDLVSGDRATYLGSINIPAMADLGSTCYSEINNINKQIRATGATVYAYLQTVGGFTPASGEVFKVTLHRIEV